jgi:glutaminyl-peptide cyclotransferase
MTSPPCRRSGSAPAGPSARAKRPRTSAPLRLAALLLALLFALAGCGDDSGSDNPTPTQNRFDADAAFALIEEQVALGQRPAGSPQLRKLATRLEARLPNGRIEPVPGGLRNVVGTIPGRAPAILIAAHYDTEYHPDGFVGANDGAAGTAAVVELARALARELRGSPHREVRFVLFDGEEEGPGCPNSRFAQCALRGSRDYAAAHPGEIGELILLDYIANQGVRIPREANSDLSLWERLRAAAAEVGAESSFPAGIQAGVIDDHFPFLERGVPAVDLIDFSYPYADSLQDTPDKLSPESLDAVGETVAALALELAAPGADQP